jgi:thiol-disulfide isomerase/thioredoxin
MSNRKPTVFLLAIFALTNPLITRADDEWDALQRDWEAAMQKWQDELTGQEDESGAVVISPAAMLSHPAVKFRDRFRVYAEKHAGQPNAIPALAWLLTNELGFPGMPQQDGGAAWALEALKRDHADDRGIMDHLPGLRFVAMSVGEQPVTSLLETIAERNPEPETAGLARIALAELLYYGAPAPTVFPGFGGKAGDRAEQKKRAVSILREVVARELGSDLADRADALLFAIERLQIGMVAPDLAGYDVNGNKIKLSQFRGNVVMIVFWATWCVPCMEMLPHERELVTKLEGKPFTLLGISVDQDLPLLKQTVRKERITWPTIHDPPNSSDSIAAKWRIDSFPTIFVLDHKGVIRYRDLMPFQIEATVHSLLLEVPATDARPKPGG